MGQKLFYSFLFSLLLISISGNSYSACSGGTNYGTITPGTSWQTVSISAGQYATFSASQGTKYTFSFCSNGGTATYDTEITILDNSGAIVSGAYNDDYCGNKSQLDFVPASTGTYRIYLTEYGCITTSGVATLAYSKKYNDDPCTAYSLGNPSCATSFSTYYCTAATNTATPGNPGCGGYNGGDIWFKTVAPFSGQLIINTQAAGITDGAMAAYKASNCSGAFTLLQCNDDFTGYMPKLSLSGLTAGDSIFIRFWTYNNAQSGSFGIYVNDPSPTYCYTGSAVQNFSSGCIQVTPAVTGQSGCIWNKTKINLATSFNYFFFVNLGADDNGADGLGFILQNSAAGMSALGATGLDIGMGGIPNSVDIEFDTFDNTAFGYTELAVDHTAISLNGVISTPVAGPIQASSTSGNIEDGVNHRVNIDWNATTKTLRVFFDGVLRLTYVNDLVTNVFGGNPNVYWGFAGSTGGYYNAQSICPGSLPGAPLPVTWSSFDAKVNGTNVQLLWETAQEKNNSEFIIESSTDSKSFQTIGNIKASGNSSSHKQYQFTDVSPNSTLMYYRIKQVDLNGEFSYSDIKVVSISDDDADVKPTLLVSPNPINNLNDVSLSYHNLKSNNDVIIVYDQYGIEVTRMTIKNGMQRLSLPQNVKAGILYLVVVTEDGILNEKILIASN